MIMPASGQGASRYATLVFQSLARSRLIPVTLLHAVLRSPSCGAEQCHRSCHHSDACERQHDVQPAEAVCIALHCCLQA